MCPPKIRPAVFNQWSRSWTAPAPKAPGPQRVCRSLLPLLSLPFLRVLILLPNDPRPFWHRPWRALEVFAPAVGANPKVHVDIWGADRRVHQRLTPAPSNSLSLLWATCFSRSVPQTGAFADAQALPPVPTPSIWTVARQGDVAATVTHIYSSFITLTSLGLMAIFISFLVLQKQSFLLLKLLSTTPKKALSWAHFLFILTKMNCSRCNLVFWCTAKGRSELLPDLMELSAFLEFLVRSRRSPPVNGPLCFLLT